MMKTKLRKEMNYLKLLIIQKWMQQVSFIGFQVLLTFRATCGHMGKQKLVQKI